MVVVVKTPQQPDYGTEIKEGGDVVEPANNARGAVTEHNVRYVLAAGLAGVVIVFAVVYLVFFSG